MELREEVGDPIHTSQDCDAETIPIQQKETPNVLRGAFPTMILTVCCVAFLIIDSPQPF
jgi:hypothetical protein